MKYFQNLPKKTFSSTIGNFLISDFFTYIDTSKEYLQTDNLSIDSKTTLMEAAYKIYQDPNAFWIFIVANKTINPFTVLSVNTNIFITENENKIDLKLTDSVTGTTGFVFPKGSIIVPFTSNTGSSASYSSIGNFDINGPLSLIESVSYYDGDMIIKDQRGATYQFILPDGNTGSNMVVLYPIKGGTYGIQTSLYPYKTKKATETVVEVELSVEEKIEDYSISPFKPKSSRSSPTVAASTIESTPVTATKKIEFTEKSILAFNQQTSGQLRNYFVTAKYL
jgi:hypothetical protein